MRIKHFLQPDSRQRHLLVALAAGVIYFILSISWILVSDTLVAEISANRETLILMQQYKGLGFVGVMALLISWLVYAVHRRGAVLERALSQIQTDALTGLANRAVAEDYLARRLNTDEQTSISCGVMLLDIRGLSRVNHSIGRSGGDQLLREVAQRIKHNIRPTDLVARLEGDRFVVILGPLSAESEALETGARIRTVFDTPITINDVDIQIELRGGVALGRRDGTTAFELLDAAERALYRNKRSGQGFGLASYEDLSANTSHLERENLLRLAIREHQFSIALQPQISLDDLQVIGAEALVRWDCPGHGQIPPSAFIPLAESLGLVKEITQQVLAAVVDCNADWRRRELPGLRLCVNLSGLDLKSGRILETISGFLDQSHIPGDQITLELTESWLMEDLNLALGLIHRLRELGPRIAIDDFGTGYSSFSQLIDFPFDYVKFDRSFVASVDHSPKKAKVLAAMQHMSLTLGAITIAEGVETIGELAFLEEIGVDEAQGFLFDKALAPADFEQRYLADGQDPFRNIRAQLKQYRQGNQSRAIRLQKRQQSEL